MELDRLMKQSAWISYAHFYYFAGWAIHGEPHRSLHGESFERLEAEFGWSFLDFTRLEPRMQVFSSPLSADPSIENFCKTPNTFIRGEVAD